MSKKPLEIDMIAGSQLRDTQGEMLSIEGADISDLEAGRGRLNDNHGKGFFNSIGCVTGAKKIFSEADCENDRHRYYWEKVKSPFIYVKGHLYDDADHPNARAAAAILRNIHKTDCPLKLKASVEGGVLARGLKDTNLLARTKIHSVALTFTPANSATLVEPTDLVKSDSWEEDKELIKSVVHLAKNNVPSFRQITRRVSAEKLMKNLNKIKDLAESAGIEIKLPYSSVEEVVRHSIEHKLRKNIEKIHDIIGGQYQELMKNSIDITEDEFVENFKKFAELKKALSAGYGGAGAPTGLTGGGVIQQESIDPAHKKSKKRRKKKRALSKSLTPSDGFKYITCDNCGNEQIYMANQVKCRDCNKSLSFDKILSALE